MAGRYACASCTLAHRKAEGNRGWLIEEINGAAAALDPAATMLIEAGFTITAMGLQFRVARGIRPQRRIVEQDPEDEPIDA